MEILVVVVVGVVGYFWFKAASNHNKSVRNRFDTLVKENGLVIFQEYDLPLCIAGLDDSQRAVCWVSKQDKTSAKILRSDDIRRIAHEEKPFNNRVAHTVVFTTNDVRDPTFKIDFGLSRDKAEDFYQRAGILFDLR